MISNHIPLPHRGQPAFTMGTAPEASQAAVLMVHGRGATAQDILSLSTEINHPGLLYLAPQAASNTWYPYSFLAPIEQNQPALSSALAFLDAAFEALGAAGLPPERTILLGFSQGACLALEYAARNPRRYGAVIAFSGGLIGPPGKKMEYDGSMEGTPVFLGCSDRDPHIPAVRVEESADTLRSLNAQVEMRLYPAMAHTINHDELDYANHLVKKVLVPTG